MPATEPGSHSAREPWLLFGGFFLFRRQWVLPTNATFWTSDQSRSPEDAVFRYVDPVSVVGLGDNEGLRRALLERAPPVLFEDETCRPASELASYPDNWTALGQSLPGVSSAEFVAEAVPYRVWFDQLVPYDGFVLDDAVFQREVHVTRPDTGPNASPIDYLWTAGYLVDDMNELVNRLEADANGRGPTDAIHLPLVNRPPETSPLLSFPFKSGWLSVRSEEPNEVAQALRLRHIHEADWEQGIEASQLQGQTFVAPALDGWVLILADWIMGSGETQDRHRLQRLVKRLSARFGEAQAFVTHRVVEYHMWMRARNGELERTLAYLGESDEVLIDKGDPTPAESFLTMNSDRTPDEDAVMQVAGAWSLDPTQLSLERAEGRVGLVGSRRK